MLESITLTNFRSHKSFYIDFDPAITTLIGPSSAGKTNLIRALRWVCLNKPAGTTVINWDADTAKAKLKVDGHTIIRKRGKSTNLYGMDGEQYLPQGIPDNISAVLNLGEISFQTQLEPHYLLLDTAGAVSKHLNSIINLDCIDEVLANISSNLRKAKYSATATEERLAESVKSVDRLKWVESAKEALDKLTSVQNSIDARKKDFSAMEAIIKSVEKATDTAQRMSWAILAGNKVVRAWDAIQPLRQEAKDLAKLLEEIGQARKSAQIKVPDLSEMENITNMIAKLHKEHTALHDLLSSIQSAESTCKRTQEQLAAAEEELHKLAKGKCPVCGKDFD